MWRYMVRGCSSCVQKVLVAYWRALSGNLNLSPMKRACPKRSACIQRVLPFLYLQKRVESVGCARQRLSIQAYRVLMRLSTEGMYLAKVIDKLSPDSRFSESSRSKSTEFQSIGYLNSSFCRRLSSPMK